MLDALVLSVLSLNLHGYHPMGEGLRFLQDRAGKIEKAESKLFYFMPDELERGHTKRLDELGAQLKRLLPDIVFFQEVAAGGPWGPEKNCDLFYRDLGEAFENNSVHRLAARLQLRVNESSRNYSVLLGCRGNTGWWTTSETFKDKRVLRQNPNSQFETVFDFNANPYPSGLIIEGTGILVSKKFDVLEDKVWHVKVDELGRDLYFQTAVIRLGHQARAGVMIAVNVHMGWATDHLFEALKLREAVAAYSKNWEKKLGLSGVPYLGVMIGGDFNAVQFQGEHLSKDRGKTPELTFFEGFREGVYDFLGSQKNWQTEFSQAALKFDHKPSESQISSLVDEWSSLQNRWAELAGRVHALGLENSVSRAIRESRCEQFSFLNSKCTSEDRIDHLFSDRAFQLQNASIVFAEDNWESLLGVSDHPGIFVRYLIKGAR